MSRDADRGDDARALVLDRLLGWGQPRPQVPAGTVTALRERLEAALAGLGDDLDAAAAAGRRGTLVVTKTRLDRLSCDGWALDPAPYQHTVANARGTLGHKALELDLDAADADVAPEALAARAWRVLATQRPGDPSSLSAWLNACPPDVAAELHAEVVTLVTTFREVWPSLPREHVEVRTEKRLDVPLAGGRVRLQGTLDLLVDSRRRDDRARALVVDFKTGVPRSQHDRDEVRFYALLTALATGRLPFRWATFYVTEGRPEAEDLRDDVLEATIKRVVAAVVQAARLTEIREDGVAPRLRGGLWCRNCLRVDDCDEADRARAAWVATNPPVA